jgi:membrane associated rhomboid family serine protease
MNIVSEGGHAAEPVAAPTRQDMIPGAVLLTVMVIAFLLTFLDYDRMLPWAVSRQALAAGRWQTLELHMFAHGSIIHIVMNGIALVAFSGQVVQRLGSGARAWGKFLLLFEVSGLAGAAAYLALHRWDSAPMLGASGAIFGLIGFLVRFPKDGGEMVPIFSRAMGEIAVDLIKQNLWLFVIFGLIPLLTGQSGGLAWEAHLGGFIAGLILCPFLLPSSHEPRQA